VRIHSDILTSYLNTKQNCQLLCRP